MSAAADWRFTHGKVGRHQGFFNYSLSLCDSGFFIVGNILRFFCWTTVNGTDFEKRARLWLEDAIMLLEAGRLESAVYLCGYAVECALKARICKLHEWTSYRDDLPGMRTHNLVNLLSFTAIENRKRLFQGSWDILEEWGPEIRYEPAESFTDSRARAMIDATTELLGEIL